MQRFFAVLLTGLAGTITHAETTQLLSYEMVLGLVDKVRVRIVDDVTGQCWTDVAPVREHVEAALEKQGIEVYTDKNNDTRDDHAILSIWARGARFPNGCCAAMNYSISRPQSVGEDGRYYLTADFSIFSNLAFLCDPDVLNDGILDQATIFADTFAAERAQAMENRYVKSAREKLGR